MDKNENNKLYIPFQFQLQMSGYDLSVKYLEKLDETCVEFTHTHVNYEIYYILSGRMRMQLGGGEHLLLPNHFILIPPGIRHGAVYEPDEPKEYVVFVYGVHRSSEPSALRRTPEYAFMEQVDQTVADRPYIIAEDKNGCAAVLSAIQNEAHGRQAGWQIILVDYCREYLIKLLRNVLTDGARASVQPDAAQGNLAVEITKFMHEHYPENISLEDVAKAFHITPRHVTRIFSDYFGTSFRRTLSVYRLNYAKNYLCTTDKTVEEIASLVGISAPQTLYRLFKENEGMTISEYRKYHRQA